MSDAANPLLARSGIRLLWISALVIVVDQMSKWWIVHHLAIGQSIELLPVFAILRTFNLGAAWSMFADAGGAQRWIFTVLAIVVSAALIYWLRRLALATHTLLATGLALILGGALGNALDRLRLGHVVDFFFAHWGDSKFPVFNVADSAISIGAVLVVLDALHESRREKLAAQAPKQAD
jgi:signal peptidase II